ncbi:hypothetical protein SAMN04488057_107122 [Cyclobacterium lianum]|uniref:Uncharacterized protein n=1 Tax=Cyclobacterium lianum TaxID=388280 RepID=A0A1M7P893_9BACT|nr:hypothetical protein [Cyclobacterium lianum]SHN12867.1 hypothetical protein SAMN04488057_107122 [Cyclobacterium lianum]
MLKRCFILLITCVLMACNDGNSDTIHVVGPANNDLLKWLEGEGFQLRFFEEPLQAVEKMPDGGTLLILAENYPEKRVDIPDGFMALLEEKEIRYYLEYPSDFEGLESTGKVLQTRLERGVVAADDFGEQLPSMRILGINDCHVIPASVDDPILVLAKVAGLNHAAYGLEGVPVYPILYPNGSGFIALTRLSEFAKGRFGPQNHWKAVWSHLIGELTGKNSFDFQAWPRYLAPSFEEDASLTAADKKNSVKRGVDWFFKGNFFIHENWKDRWLQYQGDGTNPVGPPVPGYLPTGDGSEGLLEGHSSNIYYDGSQQYRYWIRADVQGEGAYALAAAGKILDETEYDKRAVNLINFLFSGNLRGGPRNHPDSAAFGLIGWSDTHPHVYYGDDNARAILGVIGAMAHLERQDWNLKMLEAILGNFRTTGKNGFRINRIENDDLQREGWKHYWNRDVVNPAPHFESWMWAVYLWLYDKTGYQPLLEKTKKAIKITMDAYPEEWLWTNGIQQERARMILPLAWLVRVEDTPEHREWLDRIVRKLLENQQANGAIREELGGTDKGRYGRTKSNEAYGLHEAPLIFENGDPIADMLYTSNFAFFSLNEAVHATGDPKYQQALDKLSDFLTRIQVQSDRFHDLDGAWFRAFDYDKWEFWASNADVGWGAWGTLTGWTQSWIVATQVLVLQDQSYWELTKDSKIAEDMDAHLDVMLEDYR